MFAIWIKFKLARQVALSEIQSTLIAGTLLGLATTVTHYVGMAAARILVTDKTSVGLLSLRQYPACCTDWPHHTGVEPLCVYRQLIITLPQA